MSLSESILLLSGGFCCLAAAAAGVRIVRGPTGLDRILGFDLLVIASVALVVLLSVHGESGLYLEWLLLLTALGFVTTVLYFYYWMWALPGDEDLVQGASPCAPPEESSCS